MFAEISAWSGLSTTVDHLGEGHPHLLIAEAEERLVPLLFIHSWKDAPAQLVHIVAKRDYLLSGLYTLTTPAWVTLVGALLSPVHL